MPNYTGSWTRAQQMQAKQAGTWPIQPATVNFVVIAGGGGAGSNVAGGGGVCFFGATGLPFANCSSCRLFKISLIREKMSKPMKI
jgi:hypothetical protein